MMGLFTNKNNTKSAQQIDNNLTASEIELILRLLGTTHFPVKDIEILYKAIYKLQEEYNKSKDAA